MSIPNIQVLIMKEECTVFAGRLSCSVVCVLSGAVGRWKLVVCGCPGDEIKVVPEGFCCAMTDSHSLLLYLSSRALTGIAPSSNVLPGWSEFDSLIKTSRRGWYTILLFPQLAFTAFPLWEESLLPARYCYRKTACRVFAGYKTRQYYCKVLNVLMK